MSREKHGVSLPPPSGKGGGRGVAGVAGLQCNGGYYAGGGSIL
jgi:hypothetical protein